MEIPKLHEWDVSTAEARAIQEELAPRVEFAPLPAEPELVAGADVAFSKQRNRAYAAVVVLRSADMETVEEVTSAAELTFPYVPGLLTFREGPVLLEAFRQLTRVPEVFLFDGQGYAHPRRFGLACHMGLWLGVPTVGCAKSRLVGEHEEPGEAKGDHVPLTDEGERIGTVLRTRDGVRPVFVSPGHLSDFRTSRELVLEYCVRYRLPEPTRRAHLAVSRFKKDRLAAS